MTPEAGEAAATLLDPNEFRRVGVVAKAGSEEALRTAAELDEWLSRRGIDVRLVEASLPGGVEGARPVLQGSDLDLVVVLGGDGTLLSVARALERPTPILGVNMGSLGFLTEVNRGDLYPTMVRVLAGQYALEERSLLRTEVQRSNGESRVYRVLNDAVIAKTALARIIELALEVDGNLVGNFRADGLIISTPTGSTAYNLSAGGPILFPQLPVSVITPICAHTLSLRPLVVPDKSRIEVTLHTEREEVYLTLDGQEGAELHYRDKVLIGRSDTVVHLVKAADRTFYESLRGKLRWGG
ncbi:MAG TPA: NAD(+)/NADH kinase [Thermoanaerobaculia bacterium]|jgi:NAD+ kinase|nr:NAD(+)/NADH kinase [Thermoanaerobaculia bacterium]